MNRLTGFRLVQFLTTFWRPESVGPHADSAMHEHVRRRRNLRLLVSVISLGCVCVLLLVMLSTPFPAVGLWAEEVRLTAAVGAMLLAAALALLIDRWWSVEAAATFYFCCLIAVISLADSPHEVSAGRTLLVFAIPVFAAGAVLPAWSPFVFAALSFVAITFVGYGQVAPVSYLVAGMTFFILAGISWLIAASLARINAALQAANRSLRQSESDFRLLFADNPLPMVLVDLGTFEIVEANQATLTQSNFSWPQLLSYSNDRSSWYQSNPAIDAIRSGETFYEEQQHQTQDGRAVYVAVTAHSVVYGGRLMALMIGQDITARRRAEESLRTLNSDLEQRVEERTAELRHANEELERSSRYKDEFLATMSHELRTPLTGILGSADVLAGEKFGQLSARQLRSIKLIQESGLHLLSLINSVLDLSKLEARRLMLELEPMLVRDVCVSSLHIVHAQANAKGQIVTFTCVPDNFRLHADVRRLKQILINLLANAVKFTPANGAIRLDVAADFIQEIVTFCVEDTGVGIADDELANIFKPFYQIHSGLDRQYGGAGLGLALVTRLVDLHGGSVAVASSVGHGSRFTVTLPCRPQPLAPVLSQSPNGAAAPIPTLTVAGGRAPLVLLAEDNAASAAVLSDLLELAGCRLVCVQRGDEALERAQSAGPDLILMDVQMPGMDGLTATRAIRHLPGPAARIPIIALTAMALWGDRERCLEAGANDYVSKPINMDNLFEAMRRQLGSTTKSLLA